MFKKYYFTFLYNEHEDWTTGTCINNPIPHPPIYILSLEKKYATQLLKKITLGPDVRMSVKVTRKFYLFFLTLFFKNELLFSRNMMFYQLYIMFSYCRICTARKASIKIYHTSGSVDKCAQLALCMCSNGYYCSVITHCSLITHSNNQSSFLISSRFIYVEYFF